MVYKFQEDSFLTELDTKVKDCFPSVLDIVENGKKRQQKGFEVILEDTILFPEGGGQPSDFGTIDDIIVQRISRKGLEALNFIDTELAIGRNVHVKLDWKCRFDKMQQHSGQHLITALADSMFGFKTTSWWLGDKVSRIELDTLEISNEQMKSLEVTVNQKISEARPVNVKIYNSSADPALAEVRARSLPKDHTGPVRVICIDGIDENMCCGTHVNNLSQLQVIKLLKVEKSKKNKVNLFYIAGDRVINYLDQCYESEKALTNVFNGPPEKHAEFAEKYVKSLKVAQKVKTALLRDIATLEVKNYKSQAEKTPLFILHRKEGDGDFMNSIVREMEKEDVTIFITCGDDNENGLFLLTGKENVISNLGPRVAKILDGKGAGKKGRFQGKAKKISHRMKAAQFLQEQILK